MYCFFLFVFITITSVEHFNLKRRMSWLLKKLSLKKSSKTLLDWPCICRGAPSYTIFRNLVYLAAGCKIFYKEVTTWPPLDAVFSDVKPAIIYMFGDKLRRAIAYSRFVSILLTTIKWLSHLLSLLLTPCAFLTHVLLG